MLCLLFEQGLALQILHMNPMLNYLLLKSTIVFRRETMFIFS